MTSAETTLTAHLLPRMRRPGTRVTVAFLCALAVVHVQWWSGMRDGRWLAEASAQTAVNSTLAVVCVPQSKKTADEAEQIERLLSDATQRLDSVRLFDLSPVPSAEVGLKASEQVEEALRALLLRTPKRAQERVSSAVALLADAPMAADERLFARLFKAQGLTWLAGNELVKARDSLLKSLVLFPGQTVPEYAAYGTASRELFESTKGTLSNQPTGDLRVTGRGGRGDIWIDGIFRGTGTATISDVAVGSHRVTVRASGYVAERRFVDVTANKMASAEFDLKPAPFGPELEQGRSVLMANFSQPGVVEDRMRELRNQLGADQMLVIRPKLAKKTTEMTGYFLAADGTFRKVELSVDKDAAYLDKIADFVAATLGAKLLPDLASQPLDLRQSVVKTGPGANVGAGANQGGYIDPNAPLFDEPDTKKVPITRKWWFWTAVAGGVALVGGGLYLLSTGTQDKAAGATGDLKLNLHYLSN
jgi:hypothetical protein